MPRDGPQQGARHADSNGPECGDIIDLTCEDDSDESTHAGLPLQTALAATPTTDTSAVARVLPRPTQHRRTVDPEPSAAPVTTPPTASAQPPSANLSVAPSRRDAALPAGERSSGQGTDTPDQRRADKVRPSNLERLKAASLMRSPNAVVGPSVMSSEPHSVPSGAQSLPQPPQQQQQPAMTLEPPALVTPETSVRQTKQLVTAPLSATPSTPASADTLFRGDSVRTTSARYGSSSKIERLRTISARISGQLCHPASPTSRADGVSRIENGPRGSAPNAGTIESGSPPQPISDEPTAMGRYAQPADIVPPLQPTLLAPHSGPSGAVGASANGAPSQQPSDEVTRQSDADGAESTTDAGTPPSPCNADIVPHPESPYEEIPVVLQDDAVISVQHAYSPSMEAPPEPAAGGAPAAAQAAYWPDPSAAPDTGHGRCDNARKKHGQKRKRRADGEAYFLQRALDSIERKARHRRPNPPIVSQNADISRCIPNTEPAPAVQTDARNWRHQPQERGRERVLPTVLLEPRSNCVPVGMHKWLLECRERLYIAVLSSSVDSADADILDADAFISTPQVFLDQLAHSITCAAVQAVKSASGNQSSASETIALKQVKKYRGNYHCEFVTVASESQPPLSLPLKCDDVLEISKHDRMLHAARSPLCSVIGRAILLSPWRVRISPLHTRTPLDNGMEFHARYLCNVAEYNQKLTGLQHLSSFTLESTVCSSAASERALSSDLADAVRQASAQCNGAQRAFLNDASRCTAGCVLLDGLPGTGKSTALMRLAAVLMHINTASHSDCCVAVCAPSDANLDHLVGQLRKVSLRPACDLHIVQLRNIGHRTPYGQDDVTLPALVDRYRAIERTGTGVNAATLWSRRATEALLPSDAESSRGSGIDGDKIESLILSWAQIIFVHPKRISNVEGLKTRNFSCIIFDDTDLCPDYESAQVLRLGTPCLILAGCGDLPPPTMLEPGSVPTPSPQSLFSLLLKDRRSDPSVRAGGIAPVHRLDQRYRDIDFFLRCIGRSPSSAVHESMHAMPTRSDSAQYSVKCSVQFVHVPTPTDDAYTPMNPLDSLQEIHAALGLIGQQRQRLRHGMAAVAAELCVTCLSPNASQVEMARHAMSAHPNVRFHTIGQFQGSADDIIVIWGISGRVGDRTPEQRWSDYRDMVIALTRAQRALYVVGDARVLERAEIWASCVHHGRP